MKKSYLNLSAHMRATLFDKQVILLDLKRDKYYVLGEAQSVFFRDILFDDYSKNENNSSFKERYDEVGFNLDDFIDSLKINKIVETSYYKERQYNLLENEEKSGLENVDWRLPLTGAGVSKPSIKFFKCFLTLLRVHVTLKIFGMERLIKTVKEKKIEDISAHNKPSLRELDSLAADLNRACLVFPKKIKCLEWSITFVLMSLSYGWPCQLFIGVQNYPFLAHAWVQYNNKVICDDKRLPSKLSIILVEPSQGVT